MNQFFSVIINTGKTFKGGWEDSTVFFWQFFASINISEKKLLGARFNYTSITKFLPIESLDISATEQLIL